MSLIFFFNWLMNKPNVSFALKMDTESSTETLVNFWLSTRCHVPRDCKRISCRHCKAYPSVSVLRGVV